MAGISTYDVQAAGSVSGAAGKTAPLNVLMAYDGSAHAQAALALTQDLFGERCRLTAMTVLPTQAFASHESLQSSLDSVKQELERQGIAVEAILKTGSPAASLIAHAEESGADLIVMGAQGLRSTLGILLGGVTQQVVEYANVPVLVVRAPYRGIRRVLMVHDGSAHSRHTVDYLAPACAGEPPARVRIHGTPPPHPEEPARQRCTWLPAEAEIIVMHVMQPSLPPDAVARAWALGPEVLYPAPMMPIDVQAVEEQEERAGGELLAQARNVFQAAGLHCDTVLTRGDAATEILQVARDRSIDLIACGSRGLNPVSGWLLGSVSRKLVHYAPISVLIVK